MRAPRRTFATPFVFTVAAAGAVTGSATLLADPAPAPPKPPVPIHNNPPPPPPPSPPRAWTVVMTDKTCHAYDAMACPAPPAGRPVPPCNPPPPTDYKCPDFMKAGDSIKINRAQGQTACFLEAKTTCAPNVKCNPPRPRELPCPQ